MAALLSVDEARQKILSRFSPVGETMLPVGQAYRRILSRQIQAGSDWPPFSNSAMDGFAVLAGDVAGASPDAPVVLPVVFDIPAGSGGQAELQPGQAARIMTGAPVPTGADAIIPVEDTDFLRQEPGTDLPEQVKIFSPGVPGAYIRHRGHDIQAGQTILTPGRQLKAQDVGILAQLGVAAVPVYRRPRIAILSTGDELLSPDKPLSPGKIRDSNSYTLAALLERDGADVLSLGIAPDDFGEIQRRLDEAAREKVELILTTAGVSVGTFDYVRAVVESAGALDFWRVNMRPGKPVAFGEYRETPVLGLPGNPVSAFVAYEVFTHPVIQLLAGIRGTRRFTIKATLEEPVASDGRESYLRAIVQTRQGIPSARLTGHQGSGNLFSLVQANALLIVPSGVKSLPAGSEVDAWLLEIESFA